MVVLLLIVTLPRGSDYEMENFKRKHSRKISGTQARILLLAALDLIVGEDFTRIINRHPP